MEPNNEKAIQTNGGHLSSSCALPSSSNTISESELIEHDASLLPVPEQAESKGKMQGKQKGRTRKRKIKPAESGGLEEIMFYEAMSLLGRDLVNQIVKDGQDYRERFGKLEEIEVEVVALSSHGMKRERIGTRLFF